MSQYFKEDPHRNPEVLTAPQRGSARSGMAVTSLILGILSIIPYLSCFYPIAAILSLIFGTISLVGIAKSKSKIKGKWFALIGIVCSVYSLWVAVQMVISIGKDMAEANQLNNAPPSAFKQAERNILVANQDQYFFGNTPEAEALAANLSRHFKEVREQHFTSSGNGLSLTDDQFLTHCELHEDTCAFLIHVPKLRKFDAKAKRSLCDIAWMLAQSTLAESNFPEGGQLAVGVKGVVLYENIYLGIHVKQSGDTPGDSGRQKVSSSEEVLKAFFPEPVNEIPEGRTTTEELSEPSDTETDDSAPQPEKTKPEL